MNEKAIEDRIEEIKNTDPVEIVGMMLGYETHIIVLESRIQKLEKDNDHLADKLATYEDPQAY